MAHPINGIYNGPTMATTTKAAATGGGSGDASGSSGGSGTGKGGEAISTLKHELAGDDEDDSATENGKCHPSAKYFLGVTLSLGGVNCYSEGMLSLSQTMQQNMKSVLGAH